MEENTFFPVGRKRTSLRSQSFLSIRTLYLAYPKLVGTPCTADAAAVPSSPSPDGHYVYLNTTAVATEQNGSDGRMHPKLKKEKNRMNIM